MLACDVCGHANPDGANFCANCGTRLGRNRGGPEGDGAASKQIGDGRYVLDRFLGEGARKRVYLARDTALDREVAVAIVKTTGLDAHGRTRVQREAQAM